MAQQIKLGNIQIVVTFKDIKNVHLSVNPPDGNVRISAPNRMEMETIRLFAISKLEWIKQQRQKFLEQKRETPREYLDRESHYVWGERYLLSVIEDNHPPTVEIKHNKLLLKIRPGTDKHHRKVIIEDWYRERLKQAIPPLINKWQPVLNVHVERFYVQRMKTKWGSCNPDNNSIRLNTELAKKPKACLEYIIVHEMMHLIEPTHNERFLDLMDQHMPKWKAYREESNRFPVSHAEWGY
jgi:predicted metal-dependent hydrolase